MNNILNTILTVIIIGRITYIENTDRVYINNLPIHMKDTVQLTDIITSRNSNTSIEIKWSDNTKTDIDGTFIASGKSLFENKKVLNDNHTTSITDGFKSLLRHNNQDKQQEGGIRRSEVISDSIKSKDEMYWKDE